MYAAARGNLKMLKLLLAQNADPNMQNNYGWTPLMLAARSGDPLVVSTLIRYGADVRMTSSDRRSALHIARENKHKKIATILLKAGAEKLSSPVPSGKREMKQSRS
jgi:serine/threonine-protein phosphatase 6 regulatory ankyrin repeat subunit B